MEYIEHSESITGYRVKVMPRGAFTVKGYTLIVAPQADALIPAFWREVEADGRLARLRSASLVSPWVLVLGSWDPECPRQGQRYTICIEETGQTDFRRLAGEHSLFSKEIGASSWMIFEMTQQRYETDFWKDNPYQMMKKLGYRFHAGDLSVGLHFDAYPPDFDAARNPAMAFWITVAKSDIRRDAVHGAAR
ncbi:MAG: GyrI-like domain-containing protein [Chloroflexi bacterium]|nr:GyrI-like domain-containing protein [Chloroflexota bacterium]